MIFVVPGIIIFCAILLKRKYSNPYKLIFIFGKKGAGKSSLMVKWMLRDLKRGWTVYTDMPDVSIPGVRLISDSHLLSEFVPPPDSSLYLDEVGISFDNRNYKSFDSGLRDFFKLQRKYRIKVVMNSQAYDVDKKIRDCTDGMFLCSSFLNAFSLVRPIVRRVTLTESTSQGDSRIADDLAFTRFWTWKLIFLPRYFKYFKSFNAPERPEVDYLEVS